MTTCLVVQHLEPEGPYRIAEALAERGVEVEVCRVFAGDDVPSDVSGHDGLVVMGGPMSAADDAGFPTRGAEILLMGDALARRVPLLGICLGAQLLAVAAGGRVYRGAAGPEIGWMPVRFTDAVKTDPLFTGVHSAVVALHWHGDTFDLPPGAIHLATSDMYANQAFRVGDGAWGLQFHLEVDGAGVAAFMEGFGDDACARGVAPESISGPAASSLVALGPVCERVFGRFAELVCERSVNHDNMSCL